MRVLAIGDINAEAGRTFICNNLSRILSKYKIDFCVANGENSADPNGISKNVARELINAGIDVITMGNHTFDHKESAFVLEDMENVIRPYNFPTDSEGSGICKIDLGFCTVAVINLMGRVNMSPLDCPFRAAEKALDGLEADVILVDFHADATSEKLALSNFLDGRVSAVFGTHTHIQTADERILPNGTGYITDLGMTGVEDSILGVKKEIIIDFFYKSVKKFRFEKADGIAFFNGCIFDIDEKSGKCTGVERLKFSKL